MLAATELFRCLLEGEAPQTHQGKHGFRVVGTEAPLAQFQFLAHAEPKEMAFGKLKDQAAQPAPLATVEPFAIPGDRAGLGLRQTTDHLEQGGFAAATRPCHQGRRSEG